MKKFHLSAAAALAFGICSAHAQGLWGETYVSGGLSLPLGMYQDPTDPNVQYVLQQRGFIRTIVNGVVQMNDFMSMVGIVSSSGSERGLLGMAFDPDYANNKRFYLNYTDSSGNTRVSRFYRDMADPRRGDLSTRFDFRWGSPTGSQFIAQPFSNHNGGNLAFGPDGYLYIGLGDGGSAGDPGNRAQNATTWLGKMLRIDVNVNDMDPQGYTVPPDNPFRDGVPISALDEIWDFGLRNPWKYTFDNWNLGGTGALVIADVGQNAWEEVDWEPQGQGGTNWGWRNREGAHFYDNSVQPPYTPLKDPIFEYSHSIGASITGGYVYRGTRLGPDYYGRYFFADYVAGKVFSIALTINPVTGEATASDFREHTFALGGFSNVSCFGEDSSGELYVVDYGQGRIKKIRADVEQALPTSFSLIRGIVLSGGLLDILKSDDMYLTMRPGIVFSTSEAPLQLVVNATSSYATPSALRFVIESAANQGNIGQTIALYNFQTNMYEDLDTRQTATSDTSVEVLVSSMASRFIGPSSELRARISWKTTGPVFSYPWTVRVDQALWKVTR